MLACYPLAAIADAIGPIDGVHTLVWDLAGERPAQAEHIEFLVTPPFMDRAKLETIATLPALRHVQLVSAGFDHALPFVPEGVGLSNAVGVHDTATAELALTLTLAMQRDLPDYVRAQERGSWASGTTPGLADRRVLVVGYGNIGRAITRRLLPFEVSVTAVASRARAGDDLVERVHGIEALPDLVGEHDIVILIVPLTEATTHLVDADLLARFRPGALLVNVARGKVVDTQALVAACAQGRVRAALDVTDPEPLPQDHPLFSTPGVLIAPHVGGNTEAFTPRLGRFVAAQVRAYVAGQALAGAQLQRSPL
ncbi:phosphoglycerate dehydrogenase-like enzyme [Kineosphaera limosa]|uniref:Putative oxidoreductase n=1 Tax=Kineosphaera limosa NBRC 100340 TaxID=1184609 RepID=K6WUE5_9MICO|nr:2-hydroxyacid dehydrogenase [Kineosphaera limosa]NYD99526.1 phosphoglycerate dehydrogenase-like enzyme [Kineosphaera limosa]GAB95717.1 putative oxidoreductase [Kineosphaera limosa NBRC 100340]